MSGFKVNFSVNNQLATPSIHAAPFAQRPAAGQPGRVFIDTDNPSTGMYRDTGSVWVQIAETATSDVDTLQNVTDNGNTTTNSISVGHAASPVSPLDARKTIVGLNANSSWAITANNNPTVASGASFGVNYVNAIYGFQGQTFLQNATIGNSGINSAGLFINTLQSTAPAVPGLITVQQAGTIRALTGAQSGIFYGGTNAGVTYSHVAAFKTFQPINTGSAATVTNNYGIIVADSAPSSGTVTYTNRWGVYQEGASDLNYFNANLLLGTLVNTGQRLQVSGVIYTELVSFRNSDNLTCIYGTDTGFTMVPNGNSIRFQSNIVNIGRYGYHFINSTGNVTFSSGIGGMIYLTNNYAPTSGTGQYRWINIEGTINQTGGANGITRGLYINPTITSATDFRAIETTQGSLRMSDTYLAGSGSLAGSLINLTQTWNTTGTPTAFLMNITNTASGASSNLMQLSVGGSSIFRVQAVYGLTPIGLPISSAGYAIGVSGANGIYTIDNNNAYSTSGTAIQFSDALASNNGYSYVFHSGQYSNRTFTSGTGGFINVLRGFAPTSGTGVFNSMNIGTTINQTGGANGITRGLYVNPTLTSAADWRSIEWSNNSGKGIWGVGTADNAVAGSLNVGTAASANASAILQADSTTKGFLMPRMTEAQRDAIASPAIGLLIFNTDTNRLNIYDGSWIAVH